MSCLYGIFYHCKHICIFVYDFGENRLIFGKVLNPRGGWDLLFRTLPWIALLALSVSIELVSSSARVISVKSAKGLGVSY